MAVNLINNEQIHVIQDGSNITLDIQNEALKNKNVVVGSIRSKNMFNKGQIYLFKGYIDGSGKLISNDANYCLILPFEKVGTFTFSFSIISNRIRIAEYNSFTTTNNTQLSLLGESEENASTLTFTTTSNCKYLYIAIGNTTAITNIDTALNSIQIETGNTATAYSPYQNLTGEENYSTGEQVIGTWIDGKPLYRKTLYFASNGGGTSEVSYTLSNYGITNVDTIFITHPSFYSNNLNGYRNPFQYYDGSKFSCGVNATTLYVTLGYVPISNSPFVITLEYTKTTG